MCDQSDGIDLSEQPDRLFVRNCSCAPISVILSVLEPYIRSSESMAQGGNPLGMNSHVVAAPSCNPGIPLV